jgi:putative intracellular protease/amidase
MKIPRLFSLLLVGLAMLPLSPAGERAAPRAPAPPLDDLSRTNVAVLVFDGVQIIDFAGPYEVFGQAGFHVFTVAAARGPLVTTMGQEIVPAYTLAGAPPFDVLVIPGGDVQSQIDNPAVISWIREREPSVRHILSVCNGAFILARTGLLDGLSATTYYDLIPGLRQAAPKTRIVSDQRFVDNGKIITTAGLSSGIDGSLHVLQLLLGKGRAQQVALNMEYQWRPESDFARAALADRPLRQIFGRKLLLDVPGSGEARLLSTEGTADHWEARWEGRAWSTLASLQTALDQTLAETGKWTPRGPAAGGVRAWSFQDEEKKGWKATVDLQPVAAGSAGSYRLAIRVERAQKING